MYKILTVVAVTLALPAPARACTNFLISRGASVDGSTMITYAADSHVLYGELYFTPARVHAPGAKRQIHDWDSGKYLGQIPQVARTFSVVGNINEHQVAIGETTYGGRKELRDPKGGVDYGSLMWIALERARTARAAIKVMTDLVAAHGYYSKGESFSISDPKEVWLLEMIGKGPKEKGAVWVARRVPDGFVSAHANHARIRQFPLHDRRNTMYAKDVISFARKKGYFSGKDKDFSFTDAYAPMGYGDARICEARVWAMFRRVAPSKKFLIDWIKGSDKRLPLWIRPDRKLSPRDVMTLMRDHFEGTPLDLSKGIGAGPYQLPYRWRPLIWKLDKTKYMNDRATSTQQTGFSFVSQARAWLPGPIGGVHWFSVDDTYSTVYVPIYAGVRRAPKAFAVGTGDFNTFSWDSAFWVFNWVANMTYARYRDKIKDVQRVQAELEGSFAARQPEIEKAALALYKQSPELARDYLTRYSAAQTERTMKRWKQLGTAMMVKYLDGNVRNEKGKVTHPGYPKAWYRRIVRQGGETYRMRQLKAEAARDKKKKAEDKRRKLEEHNKRCRVPPR